MAKLPWYMKEVKSKKFYGFTYIKVSRVWVFLQYIKIKLGWKI